MKHLFSLNLLYMPSKEFLSCISEHLNTVVDNNNPKVIVSLFFFTNTTESYIALGPSLWISVFIVLSKYGHVN